MREREQTESAALPADYLLHEIPGPFVPSKAGTQGFVARMSVSEIRDVPHVASLMLATGFPLARE